MTSYPCNKYEQVMPSYLLSVKLNRSLENVKKFLIPKGGKNRPLVREAQHFIFETLANLWLQEKSIS